MNFIFYCCFLIFCIFYWRLLCCYDYFELQFCISSHWLSCITINSRNAKRICLIKIISNKVSYMMCVIHIPQRYSEVSKFVNIPFERECKSLQSNGSAMQSALTATFLALAKTLQIFHHFDQFRIELVFCIYTR